MCAWAVGSLRRKGGQWRWTDHFSFWRAVHQRVRRGSFGGMWSCWDTILSACPDYWEWNELRQDSRAQEEYPRSRLAAQEVANQGPSRDVAWREIGETAWMTWTSFPRCSSRLLTWDASPMLPQAAASSSIQAHALHTHPAESRRGLGFRGWGVGLRVQPPGRPRPRRAAVNPKP